MGKSYWPFLVRSQVDITKVGKIVRAHNKRKDTGAFLALDYAVRYKGEVFMIMINQGAERLTTLYLDALITQHYPEVVCFWPFQSPEGWRDLPAEDIFKEEKEFIKVLAYLPDAHPDTPIPFTRLPPPAKTPRDEFEQGLRAAGLSFVANSRIGELAKEQPCYGCDTITTASCKACKSAFYCSKECQRKDWFLHKKVCALNAASITPPPESKP